MTPHTPGPWKTNPRYLQKYPSSKREITGHTIRAETGALVAILRANFADTETPEAEKAANARLIAAVPELLKVSRELESIGRTIGDLLCTPGAATKEELVNVITTLGRTAREAIAKAEEGE